MFIPAKGKSKLRMLEYFAGNRSLCRSGAMVAPIAWLAHRDKLRLSAFALRKELGTRIKRNEGGDTSDPESNYYRGINK